MQTPVAYAIAMAKAAKAKKDRQRNPPTTRRYLFEGEFSDETIEWLENQAKVAECEIGFIIMRAVEKHRKSWEPQTQGELMDQLESALIRRPTRTR